MDETEKIRELLEKRNEDTRRRITKQRTPETRDMLVSARADEHLMFLEIPIPKGWKFWSLDNETDYIKITLETDDDSDD